MQIDIGFDAKDLVIDQFMAGESKVRKVRWMMQGCARQYERGRMGWNRTSFEGKAYLRHLLLIIPAQLISCPWPQFNDDTTSTRN